MDARIVKQGTPPNSAHHSCTVIVGTDAGIRCRQFRVKLKGRSRGTFRRERREGIKTTPDRATGMDGSAASRQRITMLKGLLLNLANGQRITVDDTEERKGNSA